MFKYDFNSDDNAIPLSTLTDAVELPVVLVEYFAVDLPDSQRL